MGHGWVIPNADGSHARCGGPMLCRECQAEAAKVNGGRPITPDRMREIQKEAASVRAQFAEVLSKSPLQSVDDAAIMLQMAYGLLAAMAADEPGMHIAIRAVLGHAAQFAAAVNESFVNAESTQTKQ